MKRACLGILAVSTACGFPWACSASKTGDRGSDSSAQGDGSASSSVGPEGSSTASGSEGSSSGSTSSGVGGSSGSGERSAGAPGVDSRGPGGGPPARKGRCSRCGSRATRRRQSVPARVCVERRLHHYANVWPLVFNQLRILACSERHPVDRDRRRCIAARGSRYRSPPLPTPIRRTRTCSMIQSRRSSVPTVAGSGAAPSPVGTGISTFTVKVRTAAVMNGE